MERISSYIWFSLNVILLLEGSWGMTFNNQSPLCEAMDMPCKRENPVACQMKYYKLNSTECRDLAFDERIQSKTGSDILGNVELKSFFYRFLSYRMAAFNVTFTKIKWKHLKFRFKQIGNDMKNTCREFFILSNSTMSEMFYDCIWSNETYEGKPFFFEYEASDEVHKVYKKLAFHVPIAKRMDEEFTALKDWETFSYVQAVSGSNGLGPTTFLLNWQSLPEKFSIDSYNITVLSNDTGTPEVIHMVNITCNNSTECNYAYSKWYGTVQFGVQPMCMNNIMCFTTKTLFFQIGGEKAKPFLIGIICATSILPVALYFVYLIIKYVAMKEVTVLKSIPKLLVIYSSSLSCHANVVLNLVEYLKNHCNVEPLIDELHIYTSKSRDPFKWCNESMKSANYIMVVASPTCKIRQVSDSIYQNTDVLLLRLLREKLSSSNSKTKFFVLMLPYSTEKDVPAEAENLIKFNFPRDLNKILKYIHENCFMRNICGRELQGGKQYYKLYGKKLSSSIEEAQQYISKNVRNIENEVSAPDDAEVDSDQEMLTVKRRDHNYMGTRGKESLKAIAKDSFMGCPENIESINLLGEKDGEEEMSVDCKMTLENSCIVNVRELDL